MITLDLSVEISQVDEAMATVRGLEISSEDDFAKVSELLRAAKARLAELEEQRKTLGAPYVRGKADVDATFKPLIAKYSTVEMILKGKISDWTRAVEDRRRAIMIASAEEYAAGGVPTLPIPQPAQSKGVSVRQKWAWEVTDEALVPREYCSPDAHKIRAQIPKSGPPPIIPGVRFFQEDVVVARKA